MISDKRAALRPILESSDGIHLTAYLVNRNNLADLKSQVREAIVEARDWLRPVMSAEDCKNFLEPLESLARGTGILGHMKGNIGLFRTKDSFRVLNIPIELEQQCQIASSFHIKPLLRWLQVDREFLLLGIRRDSLHLYFGNQTVCEKLDTILLPNSFIKDDCPQYYLSLQKTLLFKSRSDETYSWVSDWIREFTPSTSPKLFIAGEPTQTELLLKNLEYQNICRAPVAPFFDNNNYSEILEVMRGQLRHEAKKSLEQALVEFHFAEDMNLAKKNIFQIAKAVFEGRVKKLIVADGIKVFGKIDKKTGGLSIHPFDLNHEDDDILDDLAQAVLASGGEVYVAPLSEIPKGRPALAILDSPEPVNETKFKPKEKYIELN